MQNLDLEYGLGGIVRYVLSRMDEKICSNCPDVYVEYILYYEKKKEIDPPSIYDILMLPGWNKYSKACKDISLHGLSGLCLEFILQQQQAKDSVESSKRQPLFNDKKQA